MYVQYIEYIKSTECINLYNYLAVWILDRKWPVKNRAEFQGQIRSIVPIIQTPPCMGIVRFTTNGCITQRGDFNALKIKLCNSQEWIPITMKVMQWSQVIFQVTFLTMGCEIKCTKYTGITPFNLVTESIHPNCQFLVNYCKCSVNLINVYSCICVLCEIKQVLYS